MQTKKCGWLVAISSTIMLIVAGNAWGFGMETGPGEWGYESSLGSDDDWDHEDKDRSGEALGSHWSGHFDGGMLDDDSDSDDSDSDDSDPHGGRGPDFGQDWGFGSGSDNLFDHGWWREFLLSDSMDGSGLEDWFKHKRKIREFKKLIWMKLMEHWDDYPAKEVPLPVPLLLFGSGLAGLAGFMRRSKTAQ